MDLVEPRHLDEQALALPDRALVGNSDGHGLLAVLKLFPVADLPHGLDAVGLNHLDRTTKAKNPTMSPAGFLIFVVLMPVRALDLVLWPRRRDLTGASSCLIAFSSSLSCSM
jgi:hypothetical protein